MKTLIKSGFSHKHIARLVGITVRQVGHAVNRTRLTPQKPKGRSPTLTSNQVNAVENFFCASSENRQMRFFKIAHREFPHLAVSENVIRSEMKKRGYARRVAQPKPPLNPENKEKRPQFARNHIGWTVDDWMNILLDG